MAARKVDDDLLELGRGCEIFCDSSNYHVNQHLSTSESPSKTTNKMSSLEAQELEKLSEADKNDLRKFLATEQQKTSIQSQTHNLTDMCWKKCMTGSIKSSKLDRSEEGCLTNCVDRFLDFNSLTIKHIQNMRG